MPIINSARELDVYKLAYKAALEIFSLTKTYPAEEKYDLVSQIHRCELESWR